MSNISVASSENTEDAFEDLLVTDSFSPVWWNKKGAGALLVSRDCLQFELEEDNEDDEESSDEEIDIEIKWIEIGSIRSKPGQEYLRLMLHDGDSHKFRFADRKAMEDAKSAIKRMRKTALGKSTRSLASIMESSEADDMTESTFGASISDRINAVPPVGISTGRDLLPSEQNPTNGSGIQTTTIPPSIALSVPTPQNNIRGGTSGFSATAAVPTNSGNMATNSARSGGSGNRAGIGLAPGSTTVGATIPSNTGTLLYEVKFNEVRKNLCDQSSGEDGVIQFFEHVVVIRRSHLNGLYPDSYEMHVIPRFKLVGIHVSRQSETIPSCMSLSIQFGIVGYIIWLVGYVIAFCLLLVGGLGLLTALPCLLVPQYKYFLTLDVLDHGPKANFVVDCLASLLRCMRGISDKENRTTPVVFRSEEALDEEFLILYVYGIVGRQDYAEPAHMRSHLQTAAVVRSFLTGNDEEDPPSNTQKAASAASAAAQVAASFAG